MPPKSDKEIVFFLTNVGKQPSDGDPNYVEKAKEVMKLVTEKKIFLRPKDEVGIMLVGQTDNDSLIEESCATLLQKNQVPSWDIVEAILDIKMSNKRFDDWPKALCEVIEQLKEFPRYSRIILILLFDCGATFPSIDYVEPEAIVRELSELDIQLLWIGSKSLNDTPSQKLKESERVLMEILKMVNGEYLTMEKTLPSLRIFKKHKARFMAWRCLLQIGNVGIDTATYVQAVDDEKKPSFKTVDSLTENYTETKTFLRAESNYVDRHRETHPLSDTIQGYMYGRKFIPVAEADEQGMIGIPEVKSFEIFGFVKRDSIALEELAGDATRIVVPDGPVAEKPFYCLVQAMKDTETVAIVRKVRQANADPKMYVLIPHIDVPGEPSCLVLLELLYSEDRRVVESPSLKSVIEGLTKEKEDIVEEFIDSMMLPEADHKRNELFAPGTVPSPGLQHLWNSLSYRALNPEAPVPPMGENLKKLLEAPESVLIKSEPLLKKLKELFPIEDTQEASEVPQETTTQPPVSAVSEIKKMESNIEKCLDESIDHPEESCIDLDELFEADMDL